MAYTLGFGEALVFVLGRVQDRESALASPTRSLLYGLVCENPGISMSELARRAQLHWGSVEFHVTRLALAGVVVTHRAGRRRLVFPQEDVAEANADEHALLQEATCRRIALAVVEHPGRTILELCDVTGVTPRAMYHHMKRLLDMGLVRTNLPPRYQGLTASPQLYALLARATGD